MENEIKEWNSKLEKERKLELKGGRGEKRRT